MSTNKAYNCTVQDLKHLEQPLIYFLVFSNEVKPIVPYLHELPGNLFTASYIDQFVFPSSSDSALKKVLSRDPMPEHHRRACSTSLLQIQAINMTAHLISTEQNCCHLLLSSSHLGAAAFKWQQPCLLYWDSEG